METKIIQLSAGRGPAESQLAIAKLLRYLLEFLQTKQVEVTLLDREVGDENRTLKSALIEIKGSDLAFLNEWKGSVLWIVQSPFRKFHKRKNWFVSVDIHTVQKEKKLNLKDIQIQTLRSSGPGGQHVNKTETAVRITHLPSGVSTTSQEHRSQLMNKKTALKKLAYLLEMRNKQELSSNKEKLWESHLEIERGNPIKTFVGEKFTIKK